MSPTLNLARDYSCFVIAFFEVISTSAPHIYCSALPLSPKNSIVYEKYKQYACPLARVVYRSPISWEPVVAAAYIRDYCGPCAWSPCNRFIAVALYNKVEIHDAVTLNLLNTFLTPQSGKKWLSFSPDSCFLTQISDENLVTWDLQTGGSINTVLPNKPQKRIPGFSSTYSVDGKTFVVTYFDQDFKNIIATHNLSTTDTHLYCIPEGRVIHPIWTHGEFLRFATIKLRHITIWEAEFTLTHTPKVVASLQVPDEVDVFDFKLFLFPPMLSRLAIASYETLLIWDVHKSRVLLKIPHSYSTQVSFSSNGQIFAHISMRQVHVWKETPAGYILHQTLNFPSLDLRTALYLSPNGESVIISLTTAIHLWHTKEPISSSSPASTNHLSDFILVFSSNGALAAFARKGEKTVMVLDLQSGNPHLEIDSGVEVMCLGVSKSLIVVASKERSITWKLAADNVRANKNDSIWISAFNPPPPSITQLFHMSISPDLSHIVTLRDGDKDEGYDRSNPKTWSQDLNIYDASTGKGLAGTVAPYMPVQGLWFTIDGCEIWGVDPQSYLARRWGVVKDEKSCVKKLQPLEATIFPPGTPPWWSSSGYEVTSDWWILSPTQKRLLWLPPQWRSGEEHRTWNGQFLGLGHRQLSEVVILEFFE